MLHSLLEHYIENYYNFLFKFEIYLLSNYCNFAKSRKNFTCGRMKMINIFSLVLRVDFEFLFSLSSYVLPVGFLEFLKIKPYLAFFPLVRI